MSSMGRSVRENKNVTALCTHLAIRDSFKEPYTFQRALVMMDVLVEMYIPFCA